MPQMVLSWSGNPMRTPTTLLALCEGYPPVTGGNGPVLWKRFVTMQSWLHMGMSSKAADQALLALCEENPPVTDGFCSQRASNVEMVSMAQCNHDCTQVLWCEALTYLCWPESTLASENLRNHKFLEFICHISNFILRLTLLSYCRIGSLLTGW